MQINKFVIVVGEKDAPDRVAAALTLELEKLLSERFDKSRTIPGFDPYLKPPLPYVKHDVSTSGDRIVAS